MNTGAIYGWVVGGRAELPRLRMALAPQSEGPVPDLVGPRSRLNTLEDPA